MLNGSSSVTVPSHTHTHTHFLFQCGNLPDANHLHRYLSFQLGIQRTVLVELRGGRKPNQSKLNILSASFMNCPQLLI